MTARSFPGRATLQDAIILGDITYHVSSTRTALTILIITPLIEMQVNLTPHTLHSSKVLVE